MFYFNAKCHMIPCSTWLSHIPSLKRRRASQWNQTIRQLQRDTRIVTAFSKVESILELVSSFCFPAVLDDEAHRPLVAPCEKGPVRA